MHGIESEYKIIDSNYNDLKSDIVQMAHHGQNGVDLEFYKIVNPQICLFSTPEWLWNNDNGGGYDSGPWKTLETRKWIYEELNIKKVYIAKDGDQEIIIK